MKQDSKKWTPVLTAMIYSEAYQSLKLSERKVLDFALHERRLEKVSVKKNKKKQYKQSEDILIPYRQLNAKPFNMANFTITRAIDKLLAIGFLSITEQGGAKPGHATKYTFVDLWRGWNTGDKAIEERKPYQKRGFCK